DKASAMIRDLAGGKELPTEVLEPIISKTDGVPLFVEELTKMVLESGLFRDGGDRYSTVGPLRDFAIPTTLHDSLMARLDRLSASPDRRCHRSRIHVSPACGRGTDCRQFTAVGFGATHARWIDLLPADSTYIFKHALLQDAAYASLLRGRRQQLAFERIGDTAMQFAELAETQTAAHGASSGARGSHRTRHQLLTKSRAVCERELDGALEERIAAAFGKTNSSDVAILIAEAETALVACSEAAEMARSQR